MQLNTTYNPGKIEAIVGTMYSGKTEALLKRAERARKYGDIDVHYFLPLMDNRHELMPERSTLDLTKTHYISNPFEILNTLKEECPSLVIVDEIQFMSTDLIRTVRLLQKRGFNIVTAGIDKDFRGDPWPTTALMLAICDVIVKRLYPVCSVDGCIQDGTFVQRLRDGEPDGVYQPTIIIEGSADNIDYRPVCGEHHEVPELEDYLTKRRVPTP